MATQAHATFRLAVVVLMLPLVAVHAAPTTLLPPTTLTTSGNQITDLAGHPVRLACVGYGQPSAHIRVDMQGMVQDGFNCLRYPWYDATLAFNLKQADIIVAAASDAHLKVILDHHGNQRPTAANGYLPANCNGLPFDDGPGTDNTDGCGDPGTVSRARYVADWVMVAQHFAGNPTVVGFDLDNEPHVFPTGWAPPGGASWGTDTATDLQFIYSQAGNAILAVNPGALIIAEGIENWTPTLANGQPNEIAGFPDLTLAATHPVTLAAPHQLIYSIHDYPTPIGGTSPDSGAVKIRAMNTGWGYLVSRNIAPVWIGELGASLDGVGPDSNKPAKLADEQAWARGMRAYINGQDGAAGGPTFSGDSQPISTDWWDWGNFDTEKPDGTLLDTGKFRAQQYAIYHSFRFTGATAK